MIHVELRSITDFYEELLVGDVNRVVRMQQKTGYLHHGRWVVQIASVSCTAIRGDELIEVVHLIGCSADTRETAMLDSRIAAAIDHIKQEIEGRGFDVKPGSYL